jgi:hypothetical protein
VTDDRRGEVYDQLVLSDLVNRVLDRGVSVMGNVVISVAGVDLIHLGLRLDLAATETARPLTASARPAEIPPEVRTRALPRGAGEE